MTAQTKTTFLFYALFLFCYGDIGRGESLKGRKVRVCYAELPGVYFFDENQNAQGSMVQVTKEILTKGGMIPVFETFPMKRCFNRLRKGQADLMPAIGPSLIREFFVDFTIPWIRAKIVMFYKKEHQQQASAFKEPDDIKKLGKVCGFPGSNFDFVGLEQDEMDLQSKKLASVAKKIQTNRCGTFISRWVRIFSTIALGGYDLMNDPNIAYSNLPGVEDQPFAMAISEELEWSEELIEHINKESPAYSDANKLNELMKKHVPDFKMKAKNKDSDLNSKFHKKYEKNK